MMRQIVPLALLALVAGVPALATTPDCTRTLTGSPVGGQCAGL